MDRLTALILLILLAPLVLLLLTITFFVHGCNPVFIQIRTVSGENRFKFYKIRSMSKNAPNIPTGDFVNAKKYINPWGRFLRIYSLDELLNLLCIVKGDMKFIGPRPIMITEQDLISLRKNNGVGNKAGITGLAQINGRDNITATKKVACERYYQSHKKSLKLRMYIVYKTFLIVLTKVGISH